MAVGIDGLSDQYKIVATGTMTTAPFIGPGAVSAAVDRHRPGLYALVLQVFGAQDDLGRLR